MNNSQGKWYTLTVSQFSCSNVDGPGENREIPLKIDDLILIIIFYYNIIIIFSIPTHLLNILFNEG